MVFLRRKKRGLKDIFSEVFWPKMGFQRVFTYYKYRIGRLSGTPHFIALGFAFGAAASFTPLIGFHVALTVLLCYIFRASILAGILGTLVGNPWTALPIWISTFEVGRYILYARTGDMLRDHGFHETKVTFSYLMDNIGVYFWPMLAGSIPVGFVCGVIIYVLILKMTEEFQKKRKERFLKKRNRL